MFHSQQKTRDVRHIIFRDGITAWLLFGAVSLYVMNFYLQCLLTHTLFKLWLQITKYCIPCKPEEILICHRFMGK